MPKEPKLGHIQMDTMLRLVDGLKVYLHSIIDASSKFTFSLHYKILNSQNTVDFFQKLQLVLTFPATTIQTDNGLEFLGGFEITCTKADSLRLCLSSLLQYQWHRRTLSVFITGGAP
jgi:hypothetical protein